MRDIGPAIWVYMLRCSNGAYYTGTYRGADIQHGWPNTTLVSSLIAILADLPVALVWCTAAETITDAIALNARLKAGREQRRKR